MPVHYEQRRIKSREVVRRYLKNYFRNDVPSVEGQASKDSYTQNYELSYERALALSRFWNNSGIDFGKNCEVLISGSGTGGSMRDSIVESNNQRFLIHIILKNRNDRNYKQ
jgi:hypothetical protein